MMKYILACLITVLFQVPAHAEKQDQPNLGTVEGGKDLEKVKGKFRETWVNTDVDFTQYNKLYLGGALFDYRDVGKPQKYRSSLLRSSSKQVFGIAEEDRAKFEEIVDEAFMKEMGASKHFTIVEELGPNTMIMQGGVLDIISRAPPELVGMNEVYLASVGEATVILEFLDGQTGEVLARLAERRAMGQGSMNMHTMPANNVTIWVEVRRWASGWARRLRTELDLAAEGR